MKKKGSTSDKKEGVAETPSSPYERILALRTNANGAPESYVKLRGKAYRDSKWIPNDELMKNSQSSSMLTRFLRKQRDYATEPPFYNPQYDIIDKIIKKKGKKYLVKWMGLGYDQITWETEVSHEALQEFQSRSLQKFPTVSGDVHQKPKGDFEHVVEYNLGDKKLESYQIQTLNLLLNNFKYMRMTDIVDRYNTDLMTPVSAFIEYIIHFHHSEVGPYLVVTSSRSTTKWYNELRKIRDATALLYVGSKETRQRISDDEFYSSKKKLKFHILVTTPDILAHDISSLAEIKWRVAVFDEEKNRARNSQSKFGKALQQFVIGTQISILQSQPNISSLKKLTDFLLSQSASQYISDETKEAIELARTRILQKSNKRKNQPSDEKELYSTYYVDCPLSITQKKVLKKIIQESGKYVKRKNFIPLCHRILRVCSHPFLLYSQEYSMSGADLISSSTKLSTLSELLKENVFPECKILIVSEYSLMLDMVEDVATINDFKFERILHSKEVQNEDAVLYLYNPKYCMISQSLLDTMNQIIIIDGDGKDILKMLQNTKSPGYKTIYKFQCRDCSESILNNICVYNPQSIPSIEQCETVCKLSALAAFSDKAIPTPKSILQKATVVSKSFNSNESLEKEFEGCDFWSYLVEDNTPTQAPDQETDINIIELTDDGNTPHLWTRRERDQLLRGLCKFGLDRWRELIIQTGLKINIQTVIRASRALLREMLRTLGSGSGHAITKEFINKQSINEDEELNDKEFINKSVFNDSSFRNNLQKNTISYLKKIEMLHFLGESMKDKTDIYEVAVPHPTGNLPSWWTDDHDRYLVFATWKYGLGNYEQFIEDPNKETMKIFGPADDPIEYRDLNERVLKIAEAIKRKQGVNQLGLNSESHDKKESKNNNSKGEGSSSRGDRRKSTSNENLKNKSSNSSNEKWQREETRDMFQYMLKFGVPEDNDGNPDYETFARESKLINTKSVEQIQIHVEDYLAKCRLPPEESNIAPITSSRIIQRYDSFHQLREILRNEEIAKKVIGNISRWRLLPKTWEPHHELHFFRELLNNGYGSAKEILSDEIYNGVFPNNEPPHFLMKDAPIMKRIHILYSFYKKKAFIRKETKSSRSRGKGSRSKRESKSDPAEKSFSRRSKGPPPEGYILQQNSKLYPSDRAIFDSRVRYPINLGNNNIIWNLGEIIFSIPEFYNERYVYPKGYKISCMQPSAIKPDTNTEWYNEISINDQDEPLFKAWMTESPDKVYEGNSPNALWAQISKDISSINEGKKYTISGHDAFLLTNPVVIYSIQNMKGFRRCSGHKAPKMEIPDEVIRMRKWTGYERTDSNQISTRNTQRASSTSKDKDETSEEEDHEAHETNEEEEVESHETNEEEEEEEEEEGQDDSKEEIPDDN